jgi:dihydrofolate reductase
MKKIVVFNMISADGYFAGADGNIDWHVVDDEFNTFALEQIEEFDTMLFGRVTYQLFESYWPDAAKDPQTGNDDLKIANWINDHPKYVISKTLENLTWENSNLVKENIKTEIEKLKERNGKNVVIYGSGQIVSLLTNLHLVDEYRLMVNPVALGSGKNMFEGIEEKLKLKLLKTREFKTGTVLHCYEPSI